MASNCTSSVLPPYHYLDSEFSVDDDCIGDGDGNSVGNGNCDTGIANGSASSYGITILPQGVVSTGSQLHPFTDSSNRLFQRGRRARSFHYASRRLSCDFEPDAVFLRVELFLAELERRLQWLEDYRQSQLFQVDSGLKRAYASLEAVRDACTVASGELMGGGKRRAEILVDMLESRYNDALATKETLEQKAQAGVKMMENFLNDLETHVRDRGLYGTLDDGWQALDSSLNHARELVGGEMEKAKEAMRESIEAAIALAKEKSLLSYYEIPHPWRINPHILGGYRFKTTKFDCVISMFQPSNELFNIWSHLIGLLIVLAIAFYFYPLTPNFSNSTKTDIFIAAVFFFAAAKCLVCSTVWHTMNSISSQPLMECFACVDYTGISLLVAASIVTTEYTAFYCEPISCWTYILVTTFVGVLGSILPWHPRFNGHDMAWARVAFYMFLGVMGLCPIVQLAYTRGLLRAIYFYAPIMKSICRMLFDRANGASSTNHIMPQMTMLLTIGDAHAAKPLVIAPSSRLDSEDAGWT
ncbi:hypothetical protein KEM54_001308 [Ascosphaera aggregata]|nr:hypothetical protein KEM54_001308 [Ascosphaera aggregata]